MCRPALLILAAASLLPAQQPDFRTTITGHGEPVPLAVPDFRGDAGSQPLMAAFNQTLWNDLDESGVFRMIAKTEYPSVTPQQPADLGNPPSMSNWSGPPAHALYLAIGYSALQGTAFMFRGWLIDLRGTTLAGAQVFEQRYGESVNEAGARRAAHKFAADILEKFGVKPLFGTHIYFERESSPAPNRRTEIWMMDPDGGNQRQLTRYNSNSTQPAVSPDGKSLVFVSYLHFFPNILRYSLELFREVPFANQHEPPSVAAPSFTPDGSHVLYSTRMGGPCCQIVIANLDGSNPRAITSSDSNNAEPKVNPKTSAQIAFVSGRSGHAQLHLMNFDGTGVERLSDGTGETVNPCWHPGGQFLAYAGTRGVGANGWNIFYMNVAKGAIVQVTHDEGQNQHPSWAPDGMHLVFMSNRTGKSQIWSVLADGTKLRQLTTQGVSLGPVWGY